MMELPANFEKDRWAPPSDLLGSYRVSTFMRSHGLDRYEELVSRAVDDPEWFYPAALEFLGLKWMRHWDTVLDERDGPAFAHWFVGGKTNVAWLVQRAWPDASSPALVWEGDDGATRTVTAGELDDLVSRAAAGLRFLGVGRGDVVAIHLPMVPEAAVALLAIARIGAIAAPAFSGYGVGALAERLELGGTKVVITADGLRRRGRAVPMVPTALEASQAAGCVEVCVVVPRLGSASGRSESLITWQQLLSHGNDRPIEAFEAETPWLLAFTSGSTGRPKGAVHTHGGVPYGAATELAFAFDVGPGDSLCWPSDMGWLVGPLCTVVSLLLGATAVLFEGVVDYPGPDRLWQLVERHHLTHIGLSPTAARMLARAGEKWVEPYEMASLRIIGSTGEPWTPAAWQWLHRHVGRGRAPIINWTGGTEVGGGILCCSPVAPTVGCRFSGPTLGMAADVFGEDGEPIVDTLGELVVRRSWPSMTRGFWREPDRYVATYWTRFPGVWVHGDRAIKHSDGSWELLGRSDDVIKVAGKRLGPAELESLAAEVDGVGLAGAIGYPHPTKGEVAVIAVTSSVDDQQDRGALASSVADRVERALGRSLRPHAVVVVGDLPITRSGKIHRRVLRAWLTGDEVGDISSLENPQCEDDVRTAGRVLLSTG